MRGILSLSIRSRVCSNQRARRSSALWSALHPAVCCTCASSVNIQNSLLASNVTTSTQFASGGGLYSLGSVTVTGSTFSGNLARYGGGLDSEGTALLTNATLSGNRGTTAGGGIFNAGRTTLSNSTLSDNSADLGGGVVHSIFFQPFDGPVRSRCKSRRARQAPPRCGTNA